MNLARHDLRCMTLTESQYNRQQHLEWTFRPHAAEAALSPILLCHNAERSLPQERAREISDDDV